jgi:Brp/Blh family beta-carotene 15,15'-monooxygenase
MLYNRYPNLFYNILDRGALCFFFFCFSLFWYAENVNLFFSTSICFFLILTTGISHGALDHIKGAKVLKKLKIKNMLFFYTSYIMTSILVLLVWYFFPTLTLSIFLLVSAHHFGKEDSEIMVFKRSYFSSVIFLIKGSLVIIAPLFFQFNQTIIILELLNFNIDFLSTVNDEGIIEIIFYLSLLSNTYFLLENSEHNYSFIVLDLLSINILYYLLSPLVAFTLYFCFTHSFRHSISLISTLNKKNFKKGFKKFAIKAFPLTAMTATLFLITVYFLKSYYTLDEAISQVIFIGLASLTFPHILLEYLLEKNEK